MPPPAQGMPPGSPEHYISTYQQLGDGIIVSILDKVTDSHSMFGAE